jgi:CTD small phosphatase-like protein 2
LTHCSSDANLFKPHKFSKTKKAPQQRYYIDAVINAFSASEPTSFDQLCKTHLNASIDILQYIKSGNKPMPSMGNLRHLPPTKKPTLIFDLDETLIHCNENASMPCDVLLPIKFPNGATVKAGINIRPYARECL